MSPQPCLRRALSLSLQGALRARWFLGAVAAVSSRRDLVLDLIVSDNAASAGLYTFQFYKHGCWHQVVVDDFLPCVFGQDEVLFACSGTAGAQPRSACARA
jgi:Calpain family cysteine protease